MSDKKETVIIALCAILVFLAGLQCGNLLSGHYAKTEKEKAIKEIQENIGHVVSMVGAKMANGEKEMSPELWCGNTIRDLGYIILKSPMDSGSVKIIEQTLKEEK